MKLSALLTRQKGRDFYDVLFLWQRTKPNYLFLSQSLNIKNEQELKNQLQKVVAQTDIKLKQRDFEHLLFEPRKSEQILHFMEIIAQ